MNRGFKPRRDRSAKLVTHQLALDEIFIGVSFFNWRAASYTVTQRFQNSDLCQIKLFTIQEVAEWAKVSAKSV